MSVDFGVNIIKNVSDTAPEINYRHQKHQITKTFLIRRIQRHVKSRAIHRQNDQATQQLATIGVQHFNVVFA